jgi:hypothetical protein
MVNTKLDLLRVGIFPYYTVYTRFHQSRLGIGLSNNPYILYLEQLQIFPEHSSNNLLARFGVEIYHVYRLHRSTHQCQPPSNQKYNRCTETLLLRLSLKLPFLQRSADSCGCYLPWLKDHNDPHHTVNMKKLLFVPWDHKRRTRLGSNNLWGKLDNDHFLDLYLWLLLYTWHKKH